MKLPLPHLPIRDRHVTAQLSGSSRSSAYLPPHTVLFFVGILQNC